MLSFLVFAVLCTSCLANPALVYYSFSAAVGGGSGTSFSTYGEGRITGVRLWEVTSAYITGIQLRYENSWTAIAGRAYGDVLELTLFDDEVIVQVSGKYYISNYIYQLMFVTSKGRFLIAGQPTQKSFNFYPIHSESELRMLSGRTNSAGITALAAHWGTIYVGEGNSTDLST
ncbi:zymogen granule membrane protein 16-like [Chelmon rostratus]|uniref:zymogen granule membrane protein 16-like n=1 Tax=Chelmon rostratus TaxID=109905 RepID=UPI001BE65616|nr:zymogen granule membrane protein 16-like [Chelmon rostratus]